MDSRRDRSESEFRARFSPCFFSSNTGLNHYRRPKTTTHAAWRTKFKKPEPHANGAIPLILLFDLILLFLLRHIQKRNRHLPRHVLRQLAVPGLDRAVLIQLRRDTARQFRVGLGLRIRLENRRLRVAL